MAFLRKTELRGRVETLLWCQDSAASIVSEEMKSVALTLDGFPDDSHAGATRPSCVRVKELYSKGTEIRNTRQLSIVSREELDDIAELMGLASVRPAWLGANLMLSGIPALTLLPPSSRLQFPSGATLTIDVENGPCIHPARVIEEHHPGKGSTFVKHAKSRRGVTAWVERAGPVALGDSVEVHVPNQPAYPFPL